MKILLTFFISIIHLKVFAGDSLFIKVHFLYGSKPLPKFKATEHKWFGGILGGHAGVEADNGKILNFLPSGKFHVFASKKNKHSTYATHNQQGFYQILGGQPDSNKKAIFYIPVSFQQKQVFDSLTTQYLKQTPYDYALFGMRCGAATYDMLAQINVLPTYSYRKTYTKIFYPKKLRKRLFKLASANNWKVEQTEGTVKRKWEKD